MKTKNKNPILLRTIIESRRKRLTSFSILVLPNGCIGSAKARKRANEAQRIKGLLSSLSPENGGGLACRTRSNGSHRREEAHKTQTNESIHGHRKEAQTIEYYFRFQLKMEEWGREERVREHNPKINFCCVTRIKIFRNCVAAAV